MVLVFIPVGNLLAGHSRFHGSLCYGHGHFGNQTRVDRFRDEVFGAETQVVYVVGFIDYIGHRFLCQVGDGVYGSQFHFFVDGCSACVECSTEDIRESDNIVYLVRIVRTSGRHQDIRTGSHGVFVWDFRSRVGQCEDNRVGSHAAYHILAQDISSWQAKEHVGSLDGFCQCVDVGTVCRKIFFLLVKVCTFFGNHSFTVEHDNVFQTGTERHI